MHSGRGKIASAVLPLLLVVGLGLGCEGQLQFGGSEGTPHPATEAEVVEVGPGATDETEPDDDPTLQPQPVDIDECAKLEPTPVADVPARLITGPELNNALETLFPDLDAPDVEMPNDTRVGSFVLNAREKVSAAHVRDFQSMAEDVAELVATNVDAVAPCDESDATALEQCAHAAIDDLGERAFRRPLTAEEIDGLNGLYALGSEEAGHAGGMRYVVEAILQAPSFMYITEDTARSELSDHEIAQRMSAILWRSIPDDTLIATAEAGELTDPAVRETQARRMLDDERGQAMMRSLVLQWLGFDRLDEQPFAQNDEYAGLAASMKDETIRLVDHVTSEGGSSWVELLNSPYTFVDARLAEHYGISIDGAEEVSDGVYRVEMPDRAGLLTQAGFLALHHGPVHRGLAVRKAILCDVVPGPAGVDIEAIPTEPDEAERSKSEKRLAEQSCGGCHSMMDPIGLTFDTFDPLGAPRTEDTHGNPVYSDGELLYTEDADGEVADASELAGRLAGSEDVRQCVAENLFVWAFARPKTAPDGCTIARIEEALLESDDNLREALIAIVSDEMFTQRLTSGGQQ